MRSDLFDRALSWLYVRQVWGGRCPENVKGCPSCDKWAEHDWLFNDGGDPDMRPDPFDDEPRP